jgi:hypothetical protein
VVQSQPRQIVLETFSRKYPSQKGLAEWLKVKVLGSSPGTEKKKKKDLGVVANIYNLSTQEAKSGGSEV